MAAACTTEPLEPSPTDPTTTSTTLATTTTTSTTIPVDEAITRFVECMDEAGIEIEPIPLDAQGRPRLDLVLPQLDFAVAASSEALARCAEHLTAGALDLSMSPDLQTGVQDLLEAFSECVRDRGVPDFPDPVPGFSGVGGPYPASAIPYDDPDLENAAGSCQERLVG